MKINPIDQIFRLPQVNQTKSQRSDGDGSGTGREAYQKNSPKNSPKNLQDHSGKNSNKESPNNAEEYEVEEEKVITAIAQFEEDHHKLKSGVHAEKLGSGPGLKIVLKDSSGGILRRMSGEEFLKLRAQTQQDIRPTGKLLDKKL